MDNVEKEANPDLALAKKINELPLGEPYTTKLAVDDRVIARVTDGIYRQPSSALRELISNAYDADATRVIVHTDAPRFDRIVIRDNGNGMSTEVVAYLVTHIGGSSKRTARGKELGTVNEDSVFKSKAGRKLIGKIGIGLFAVSQLTQHFQIITKRKGDSYRTSAVVVLKTHTEELLADSDGSIVFDPGSVTITRELASDIEEHGTDIILMDLRKSTKDSLGSLDRWQALDEAERDPNLPSMIALGNVTAPVFHIGRVDPANRSNLLVSAKLPWSDADSPAEKFSLLYQAMTNQIGSTVSNPTTEEVLDSYLKTLWDISLSVPVEYLDKHPFETTQDDGITLFQISNEKKGQASELILNNNSTISEALCLESSTPDPAGGFTVIIDGVELKHPVKIDKIFRSRRENLAQKNPILFIGKCITPFSNLPATLGGGGLEFEAYFYWNPIIVPKENNGVLIRINNASGTLFDETFLDYRVSELTRLKQIMAEVYITKGLDPALNIDRESFNSSHPHYQYIKDWIHRALRQATNRLKGMNREALDLLKNERLAFQSNQLLSHAEHVWTKFHGKEIPSPDIEVVPFSDLHTEENRRLGRIVLEYTDDTSRIGLPSHRQQTRLVREAKIKALVVVLTAYGLTEGMSYEKLQMLIRDIEEIFDTEGV